MNVHIVGHESKPAICIFWIFIIFSYIAKLHPLQLHIHRISKCLKHIILNHLSYIMLEHEKRMLQNSENWKFVGSSQQLLKCR